MKNFLHPHTCQELPEDLCRMESILSEDPEALEFMLLPKKFGEDRLTTNFPLHDACQLLHVDCVRFLLEHGARVDRESIDGKSAIYYTVIDQDNYKNMSKCIQIVKLLLQHKPIDGKIYCHEHSLYFDVIVMIHNNLNEILKLMLEYGEVSANVKDFSPDMLERNSPIIAAIEAKNIDAMKLLIFHGAYFRNYMRYGHGQYAIPCHIVQFYNDCKMMLRALKIFQCFGGSFWTQHRRFTGDPLLDRNQTALDLLKNKPQRDEETENSVEALMGNPLGLREQCRLSIWKQLGSNYWKSVDNFELPVEVKDFLKLADL